MFKIQDDWHSEDIDTLSGGLRLDVRPDKIDKKELLDAHNVLIQRDLVQTDSGYVPFADAVSGIAQTTFQFVKKNGTEELLCVSTASVYVYNSTFNQWDYVKGTVSTLTTGTTAAGGFNLTVTAIAGFANGEKIGVFLDNGKQHKTTINGVPAGNTIVMAAAVPVGRSVAIGVAVRRAVVLTGDLDNQVSVITVPSHDWCVFTNFNNPPMRYDGVDCVVIPGLPSSGDFKARAVILYNAALFFGNCIEGGTQYPMRVRRSEIGDPTNWSTGTAGFDNLYDLEDGISTMLLIGPYLIIYRERSIARGTYVNVGGKYYDFETTVVGEGTLSLYGVADAGDVHVVVGHSNIYLYRGGFDIEPVGDAVYYKIFGSKGELNPQYTERVFAFYVEEVDEIWIFLPIGGSTVPNKMYRYSIGDKRFSDRTFNHNFSGFGFFVRTDDRKWTDLLGSWASQTWDWNSKQNLANSPTTHLCDSVTGQIYEYNYTAADDNGAIISYSIQTKDFTTPFQEFRVDYLEAAITAEDCTIDYSTDQGLSWNTIGYTADTVQGRKRFHRQFVGTTVRFKFWGSGAFELGRFGFTYRDESYQR